VNVAQGEDFNAFNHQRHHAQQNHHDRQHRDLRYNSAALTDFVACHFTQSFSVTPDRAEQNNKILHTSRECAACNQPKRSWQIPELCGECWPNQRAGASDCRKVVPEQNPFVGRHKIAAIIEPLRGCGARIIKREQLRGDKCGIQTVGNQVAANRSNHKPSRADGFPSIQRNFAESNRAANRDRRPRCNR